MPTIYELSAKRIDGSESSLDVYRGKVLLIVNVASHCGFTYQYAGLQSLHQKYADQGLAILGFPCNQFGNQEPGNEEEIRNFCSLKYDVSFDMFSKVDVNGANTHPVFVYLKKTAPGLLGLQGIKWNFTKFLVGRDGQVLKRYSPTTKPESLEEDIQKALQEK
jgi:glutathione peroxidase